MINLYFFEGLGISFKKSNVKKLGKNRPLFGTVFNKSQTRSFV